MAAPTGNTLLDALEDRERDELLAGSRTRPIDIGSVLHHPGDTIVSVFFPLSGTLSLIAEPDPDHPVEAATIGREGVANAFAALGSREAVQRLIGQIEGEMIEVPIDLFVKLAREPDRLSDVVHGFTEALISQVASNAACNAIHHVNKRCARWLLQSHDRVNSDTFGLKQEFLAIMLGVSRPTVSLAAESLKKSRCITYNRGVISVLDREALEAAACPCYEAIRTDYVRLVPLRFS
jgi:CRP-like cAMP-binding protein